MFVDELAHPRWAPHPRADRDAATRQAEVLARPDLYAPPRRQVAVRHPTVGYERPTVDFALRAPPPRPGVVRLRVGRPRTASRLDGWSRGIRSWAARLAITLGRL